MIILYCAELDEICLLTGFINEGSHAKTFWDVTDSMKKEFPGADDLLLNHSWEYIGCL